jgi:hypothetical protein
MLIRRIYSKYISGYREYFHTLKSYGISGLIIELRNRSRIWTIRENAEFLRTVKADSTSISDEPNYLAVCLLAAQNSQVLKNFKRCHEYRLVLEHVTRRQGEQYLGHIKNNDPILRNMKEISLHEIGDPLEYPYKGIGNCSPTQLRYAKIMQDLQYLYDFSQIKNITEIGIGNGGQAAQICNMVAPTEYNFIDLRPVLDITRLLISKYNFATNFNYLVPSNVEELFSDLFISNYAFSELNKKIQNLYLEKILKNSTRGFMLYNHIHENPNTGYRASEILDRIPGSIALAEVPHTYPGNLLIAWGFNSDSVSKYFTRVEVND